MWFLQKKPNTLAIIGNGFDMAHGYKTDYRSFVENTRSVYLEKFKFYCEAENISTWYLFEDNIRIITERFLLAAIIGNCNFDENRKEINNLAAAFTEIQHLLLNYLYNEITSKPFIKKRSIEKYIGTNTVAINFNYTQTAEKYLKRVFYVHGSLAEHDILLGYDYRGEPCLAQFEDMRWSKSICREALAFRRFLQKRKRLSPNSRKYREFLSGFENYQRGENSNRGIDNEIRNLIPRYRTIDKFLTKYRSKPWPNLNYKSITTIVVLGHGIEADKVYLRTLLDRCESLNRIVMFRYDSETEESYQNKCSFFVPYCSNIEQIYY